MLPKKPIKKALQQASGFPQISMDAVIEARKILERLLHQMGLHASQELDKLNENREQQGLRKMQRLNAWAIKNAAEKLFSAESHNRMGLQSNEDTSPGGKR